MNLSPLQPETNSLPVPELPLLRLRLHFQALTTAKLPAFQGSTWRGVFGHQLKQTVCVTGLEQCPACYLHTQCIHSLIFDTPITSHAKKMRRYNAAPHPFVFNVPWQSQQHYLPGDTLSIGLTLFGKAIANRAYIFAALQKIHLLHTGQGKGRFQLIKIEQESLPGSNRWVADGATAEALQINPVIPPLPSSHIKITLHTPLRLSEQNKLVNPQRFCFHHLLRNVLRRLSMLSSFHTDTPFETDFANLTRASREIAIEQVDLQWCDWERYSNRKCRKIKMGGLRGSFEIKQLPQMFWPLLWLGQWTHAGKGTAMGLGHYSVTAVNKTLSQAPENPA